MKKQHGDGIQVTSQERQVKTEESASGVIHTTTERRGAITIEEKRYTPSGNAYGYSSTTTTYGG